VFAYCLILSSNLPLSPCYIVAHVSSCITTQKSLAISIALIPLLAPYWTIALVIALNGHNPPLDSAPRKPKRVQVNVACNKYRRRKVKVRLSLSALHVGLSRTTSALRHFLPNTASTRWHTEEQIDYKKRRQYFCEVHSVLVR
jgi:hypothetical protein